MPKKEKATAITKRNIQDAFWHFYSKMPMEKIRINAVMEHAGYNRGTFYEYFKSLDDVLVSIETEIYNDFLVELKRLEDDDIVGVDMLLGAVYIVIKYRDKLIVLLGESGDNKFREALVEGTNHAIDNHLRKVYRNGIDIDSIPNYEYLIEFISTGMWGTLIKWVSNSDNIKDISFEYLTEYFEKVSALSNDFCKKMLLI